MVQGLKKLGIEATATAGPGGAAAQQDGEAGKQQRRQFDMLVDPGLFRQVMGLCLCVPVFCGYRGEPSSSGPLHSPLTTALITSNTTLTKVDEAVRGATGARASLQVLELNVQQEGEADVDLEIARKEEMLRRQREEQQRREAAAVEWQLLRDCLWVFQGIDGQHLVYDAGSGAHVLDPEVRSWEGGLVGGM